MSDDLLALFSELGDTDYNRTQTIRGYVNYLGNKWESLEHILPMLPYRKKYIEVFGGSGAVLTARQPSKIEIFNDRNSGITCFFMSVIEDCEKLISTIKNMPHSRELFYKSQKYIDVQDQFLRGAYWYYHIQSSFSGRGDSFGRVTNDGTLPGTKINQGLKLLKQLQNRWCKTPVQVENLDWRQCFKDFDCYDSVWYLDPPYVNANFYKDKMTIADHKEMCSRIMELKGFVALSGFNESAKIYDDYKWDDKIKWEQFNRVKTGAIENNSRDYRYEYLWIKK